jgi:hypothetical protein
MASDGKKGGDGLLVLCLAAGLSVAATARKAGVSARTVRRRLADPAFRTEVQETRSRMVQAAVGKLAASAGLSVQALRELARSGSLETARVSAAKTLLEFLFRGAELDVLARELEALRQELEALKHGDHNLSPAGAEDAGGGGKAGDEGPAAPGGDPQGPRPPDGPGGDDPGPLAGGVAPLF